MTSREQKHGDGVTHPRRFNKSIIFPPLESQVNSHPLRVRRTLYLVTKSSVALAAESAGLVGSDIAAGEEVGREVRR